MDAEHMTQFKNAGVLSTFLMLSVIVLVFSFYFILSGCFDRKELGRKQRTNVSK